MHAARATHIKLYLWGSSPRPYGLAPEVQPPYTSGACFRRLVHWLPPSLARHGSIAKWTETGVFSSKAVGAKVTPCRTRTHNLRCRSPTPCALGQGDHQGKSLARPFVVRPNKSRFQRLHSLPFLYIAASNFQRTDQSQSKGKASIAQW